MNPSEQESMAVGDGPISALLSGVSAVTSVVDDVPLLSSFAAPVSWATSALAKTAAAFGFSKPHQEDPVRFTVNTSHGMGMANCDGPDPSWQLGLLTSNKIALLPGFAGTDEDEMALASIYKRKAWISTFPWAVSTVSGTLLYSVDLYPQNFTASQTDGTISYYTCTPVAFCARLFRYWRGNIVFTFKIVKTDIHSGRILVAFFPGISVADAPSIDDAAFAHSTVIDINRGTEFEVVTPFTHSRMWLQRTESIGSLHVYVLNELVAPTTVSQQIQVIAEVSGQNMEFHFPDTTVFAPYLPDSVMSDRKPIRPKPAPAEGPMITLSAMPPRQAPLPKGNPSFGYRPAPETFPQELQSSQKIDSVKFYRELKRRKKLNMPIQYDRKRDRAFCQFEDRIIYLPMSYFIDDRPDTRVGPVLQKKMRIPDSPVGVQEPQSALGDSPVKSIPTPMGGMSTPGKDIDTSMYCAGEKVDSLRSLAKRFVRTYPSALTLVEWQHTIMRPMTTSVVAGNGTNTYLRGFGLDYLSLIASLYAYNRGSVRVLLHGSTNSTALMVFQALKSFDATTSPIEDFTPTTYGPYFDGEIHRMSGSAGSVISPPYQQNVSRLVRFAYQGVDEPVDQYTSPVWLRTDVEGTMTSMRLYRAAADDWECGYFLGIPPLIEGANLNPAP
jgi:hypothetical protein